MTAAAAKLEHITWVMAPEDGKEVVDDLRKTLCEEIYQMTAGVVQAGPFKGMKLLREECWVDGNMGAKLLGSYESELHDALEKEIERLSKLEQPKIVNIGCAEGFYVIGMKRRIPHALVIGIDVDENALRLTNQAAAINDVSVGFVTDNKTGDHAMFKPDLIICDCEGAEIDYLDPERFPEILKSTVIVECHAQVLLDMIVERFLATHHIWMVEESWRNAHQYPMIRAWTSHKKWLAVSEGRPCAMYWLVMHRKEAVQ